MLKKLITDYRFPDDLRNMTEDELEILAYEIRDFLIEKIAKTGGHAAPNLGVVELTVAIHKVFDIPSDQVVWDVGHQSYVHKILTGRADGFDRLRQYGGISGFPKSGESDADVYNSGHSSTSISVAMGLAEARDLKGGAHKVLAVIGDGAMTGGEAFEGLNNAGNRKTDIIVILNDNEMSISKNIGSLSHHLNKLRSSRAYLNMKKSLKKSITGIPGVGEGLYRGLDHMRDLMRYAVITESIFEDLGFSYYGPVDGNNLRDVTELLEAAKSIGGPVLIHAITKKGKGYRNAEIAPDKFHSVGPFDTETGKPFAKAKRDTWSALCGKSLIELAEKDERVIAVTAAMTDGTGLLPFADKFPERFFDVGIAEAHAVTFAAGLAIGGMRPFVCCYSTFLQRAYDQIVMDAAMQNLPVVFMIDRAGNVGHDGETHHGVFDLSYLKHIPNMTIMAPADGSELVAMMRYALFENGGPCAIRYPKGVPDVIYPADRGAHPIEREQTCGTDAFAARVPSDAAVPGVVRRAPLANMQSSADGARGIPEMPPLAMGKSAVLREGRDMEIWAVGNFASVGLDAADLLRERGVEAKVVNPRFVKPLDEAALRAAGRGGAPLLILEDNVVKGGFGESVLAFLAENGYGNRALALGWPDDFVTHGSVAELRAHCGLDAAAVARRAERLCERNGAFVRAESGDR
ncbi:MAG: 1-deoxy-D-xylulose-5-phosphate synthase [Clostridiales Family XIII bacterium]|jgi:1-deoxy-D-xylulose-5-phosphate synthase|nr:1-deoxy-D-xylulose-5-phosphate synthase [Clostridiales Family XIII bacterium]